jgi:hypothetical protein
MEFGEGDFAKFLSKREGEENTKQSWEGKERYTISPEQKLASNSYHCHHAPLAHYPVLVRVVGLV